MTQAGRPIAFFSRTQSLAELKHSAVEREAMTIVVSFRKWADFIRSFRTLVKTDQKLIVLIFASHSSRIKNDKLTRYRLELSEFIYDIEYEQGPENTSADALSRIASIGKATPCALLHDQLKHPGVVRMWEFVGRHNYAFSIDDVKDTISN